MTDSSSTGGLAALLVELGWKPRLVLPWTAAGSLQALWVVTEAESMDRRILITLLGAAACAPAHEW